MTDVAGPVRAETAASELSAVARASALRAATRSGTVIRPLSSLDDMRAAEALLLDIWQPIDGQAPLAADLMRALSTAGSYAVGAYDDEVLVGTCVGFWGDPLDPHLHSHIAGVAPGYRDRHIGYALKLDQRAHALELGVSTITWTFDPLQARNAHFNLRRLGARPTRYHLNYYGAMVDALNGDDDSDRFLLRWDLLSEETRHLCDHDEHPDASTQNASPLLAEGNDGRPVIRPLSEAERVTVAIPSNIERLRRTDPGLAREWRTAVRTVFTDLLARGAKVVDFAKEHRHYVVEEAR